MFLTQEELITLTGKRRSDAQIKALRYMGIEHRQRPDGSIAVLKSHIEKEFAGIPVNAISEKKVEPNWKAV